MALRPVLRVTSPTVKVRLKDAFRIRRIYRRLARKKGTSSLRRRVASPAKEPETLREAIRYFSDLDVADGFFAKVRWPDSSVCPRCGRARDHYYVKPRRLWQCKGCKKQFSVKVGTIFEDSPIGMDKWLPAMWTVVNHKRGRRSSYELARDLGVTQKTAWFMFHRLELAM